MQAQKEDTVEKEVGKEEIEDTMKKAAVQIQVQKKKDIEGRGKEDTASAKGQAVKKTTEEAIKEEDWKQIVKVNTKINLWEKKEQGNLLKEK